MTLSTLSLTRQPRAMEHFLTGRKNGALRLCRKLRRYRARMSAGEHDVVPEEGGRMLLKICADARRSVCPIDRLRHFVTDKVERRAFFRENLLIKVFPLPRTGRGGPPQRIEK